MDYDGNDLLYLLTSGSVYFEPMFYIDFDTFSILIYLQAILLC